MLRLQRAMLVTMPVWGEEAELDELKQVSELARRLYGHLRDEGDRVG